MSVIDVDGLLQPISPDAPCGEDLSYDPEYMELERTIQGSGEHQMGDSVIEAEEPNWKEISERSLSILQRTRDMRVIVYLTLASMKKSGVEGLRDGMQLLAKTLEQYWDDVHPKLDPDDDYDPMERMNILASIAARDTYQDPIAFLDRLRSVTLVSAPQLGSFSLQDYMLATGQMSPPEGMASVPQTAHITGAFESGDQDQIAANGQAVEETIAAYRAVNDTVYEKVGAGQSPDLSALEGMLLKMQKMFADNTSSGEAESYPEAVEGEVGQAAVAGAAPAAVLTGEVRTRDDVMKALDKICLYYEKFEPSSPLPMLLKRARRLVEKDFLEIMKDLAPESMPQIEIIGGIVPEEEGYGSAE
jgi:type VI secretion system protein ImpA